MKDDTSYTKAAGQPHTGSYLLDLSTSDGACALPLKVYSIWKYLLNLCSYDLSQWTITFMTQWAIMTLQIIAFMGNNYIDFRFNSAGGEVLMGVATFFTEMHFSLSTDFFISISVLSVHFVTGSLAALLHHLYGWLFPVHVFRYFLMWIPTVFYIPLIMPHFKIVFSCLAYPADSYTFHPFANEEFICWQGVHITYFVISFLTIVTFFASSTLVNLCYFNAQLPQMVNVNKNPINAANSNRPAFFVFLAKNVLLVLLLAGHSRTWRFAMACILVGVGLAACYHHILYLPHWNELAQWLSLSQCLIFVLLGLATFFNLVLEDQEGTGMLFFVSIPVVMILAAALVRWRYHKVAFLSEREIDEPELVIAKAQATIREFIQRVDGFGFVYVEDMPEVQDAREDAIRFCEAIFTAGLRRFPDSAALHIFVAQFHTYVAFNRVLAYRELDAAAQCKLGVDEAYRCHLIRHALGADTRRDRSAEVLGYLEFAERRVLAYSAAANATRHLISFWSHLLTSEPSLAHLAREGQAARSYLSACEFQLQKLLELNPHSVLAHRLYALICAEILGDSARAVSLLERAKQLEQWREKRVNVCNFADFLRAQDQRPDIFDENNGVVTISMKEEKLGIIELANTSLARQLGFRRSGDLIGRSISSIIPEPIRSHHNDYLREYLTSKRSRVVGYVRVVLAQHQQQHLKPYSMFVRWADEALGKLIAVLQPLHNASEICLLVQPATLRVTASTATLYSLLGYNRRALAAGNISLNHIVPVLNAGDGAEEAWGAVRAPTGLRMELPHAVSSTNVNCHVYVVPLMVHEEMYFMTRILVRDTAKKSGPTNAIAGAPVEDADSDVDEELRAAAALSFTSPIHTSNSFNSQPLKQSSSSADPSNQVSQQQSLFLAPTLASSSSGSDRSGRAHRHHESKKRAEKAEMRTFDALGEYREASGKNTDTIDMINARRREEERAMQKESMKTAQKKRVGRGHLRLKRAIENDNKRAVGRLEWLKIASVSLLVLLIALQIIQYVLANNLTEKSEYYLEFVHQSSLRGSFITDSVFHYRIYNALFAIPLPGLYDIFWKPGVHPSKNMNDIFIDYRDRAERSIEAVRTISMKVDHAAVNNAQMHLYRTTNMFPVEFLHLQYIRETGNYEEGVRLANVSLPDAMAHFSALGNFGLFEKVKDDAHDHGYFYMLTNTVLGYFEAANEAGSRVFMSEVAQAQDMIYNIAIVCVVVSLVVILFVALVFFRPLLVEVDAAKLTVLEIFLSIPTPLRRKLRTTAINVYNAVRQSQLQFEANTSSQDSIDEVLGREEDANESSDTGSESLLAVNEGWSGLFTNDPANTLNSPVWEKEADSEKPQEDVPINSLRITTNDPAGASSLSPGRSAVPLVLHDIPQVYSLNSNYSANDASLNDPFNRDSQARLFAFQPTSSEPSTTMPHSHSPDDSTQLPGSTSGRSAASVHSVHSSQMHMRSATTDMPLLIGDPQGTKAASVILNNDGPIRSSSLNSENGPDASHTHVFAPHSVAASTDALATPQKPTTTYLTPPSANRSIGAYSATERYQAHRSNSGDIHNSTHSPVNASKHRRHHSHSEYSADASRRGAEAAQKAKVTLGNRTAIRAAFLRVFLFMICVAVYYTVILIISHDHRAAVNADAMFLYVAAQRLPKLQLSFFYASINTLFDRDTLVKYDPVNPLTRNGPFWDEATSAWNEAEGAIYSIVYGNSDGIKAAVSSKEQDTLMYGDACSITQERALQLYHPTTPIGHLWSNCDTFEGGMFRRGFLVAFRVYEDAIREATTKRASLALENNIFGKPAKAKYGQAYVDKLLVDYRRANVMMNEYLFHWLMISGGLYRDHIAYLVNSFMTTRLILFCVFLGVTVLSYWLLFSPLVTALARGIAETNSMTLLLPPSLISSVPAAQEYIRKHIARD